MANCCYRLHNQSHAETPSDNARKPHTHPTSPQPDSAKRSNIHTPRQQHILNSPANQREHAPATGNNAHAKSSLSNARFLRRGSMSSIQTGPPPRHTTAVQSPQRPETTGNARFPVPTSPNQEAPALFTETHRHQSDIGKPSFFRNSICTQSDDVVRMQTPLPQGIHQRSGRFRPGQPHQRSERHARPVAEIWRTNSDRRRHQDHNCPDRAEQCPNRRRCPRAIQHCSRRTLLGDLRGSRMPWGIAGCRNAPPLPSSITFFKLLPVALRDRAGHTHNIPRTSGLRPGEVLFLFRDNHARILAQTRWLTAHMLPSIPVTLFPLRGFARPPSQFRTRSKQDQPQLNTKGLLLIPRRLLSAACCFGTLSRDSRTWLDLGEPLAGFSKTEG